MLRLLLVVLLVAIALPGRAEEGRRLALVIGNDSYPNIAGGSLAKAGNDARGMAAALGELGFEVTPLFDQTQNGMFDAVVALRQRVRPGDTVVLFYAGHGVQIDGRNYLIPSDFVLDAETKAHHYRRDAIALDWMLDEIQASQPAFTLAIVDACRDNPLRRADGRAIGGSRGLAPPASSPQGTMIVYSAGANQEALDTLGPADADPNGVFTRAFLPLMRMPGKTIQEVVWDAKYRVIEMAKTVGHVQTPAIYDQSVGRFFFRPGSADDTVGDGADRTSPSAVEAEIQRRLAELLAAERAESDRRARDAADRAAREAAERVRREIESGRAPPPEPDRTHAGGDGGAKSGAPPVTECDRLAATADDPDRVAPVVPDGALDAAAARAACEAALARYPDTARLHVQLARAAWALRDALGEPSDGPMARLGAAHERAAVALGHPLGQFWYGNSHAYGEGGLPQDHVEAVRLYRLAAEQGLAAAQNALGYAYQHGEGVASDPAEAMRWYRRAADQGFAPAQSNIGYLYDTGSGVEQSSEEAVRWYRTAAERGDPSAQTNLGYAYQYGRGVGRDPAQAMHWYRRAADQGFVAAQHDVGFLYENGIGVAPDPAEAARWYARAAEQGYAAAQLSLGTLAAAGRGVAQSPADAADWFRRAAEQGDADAQNNLGFAYQHGRGVLRDPAEAMRWYQKAAAQDNATARYNIGFLYQHGIGVAADPVEAMSWYRSAAGQGHSLAQTSIGLLYEAGEGVARDEVEALLWYARGHASARTGDDATTADQGFARSTVRTRTVLAQWLLQRLGYDPGPVDGAMGPRTRDALRGFQGQAGLRATAEPDADTLAALARAADTL